MASGGSRGSGRGAGTRAIDVVASAAPAFTPRGATLARATSARVVDRWAPERGAAGRSRSLGAMAFADRLLSSYVAGPASVGMSLAGSGLSYAEAPSPERGFRSPPPTSWLFPSPWYQDELDWIDAAQRTQLDGPRGEVARAMSMPPRALALVAPALAPARTAQPRVSAAIARAAGRSPLGDGPAVVVAPTRRAASVAAQTLRAWSPLVGFAAVQAAEVMAGALGATPELEADLERGGFRATDVPVMELIAPAELAALAAEAGPARRSAASVSRAPARPRRAPAPSRVRLEAARERLTRPAAPPQPVATSVGSPPAPPAAGARATDLLAAAALSAGTATMPASGPRVAMPAGLGGLVAGVTASGAVRRPLITAQTPIGLTPAIPQLAAVPSTGATPMPRAALNPPTPVYARSALSSIESTRPAALEHVAWADHWLARFAGASRPALAALDDAMATRSVPSAQLAPEPIFLSPEALLRPGRAALSPAAPPSVARPPAPRQEALRIDDDESVPDEIFEALARAAAGAPPRAPAAPVPPPQAPARALPSLADRVLAIPPSSPGAGLRAQLAASPAAAALRTAADLPAAQTFDVRALEPAGVARAYLDGAILPLAVRVPNRAQPHVLRPLSFLAGRDLGLGAQAGAVLAAASRAPMSGAPGLLRMLAARAPEVSFVAPAAFEPSAAFEPTDAGGFAATAGDLATVAPRADIAAPTVVSPSAPPAGPVPAPPAGVVSSLSSGWPSIAAGGPAAAMPFAAAPMIALDLGNLAGGPGAERSPARPGVFGASVESWATDHLQEVADLSLDFVAPELILAAREYGFGPVEAARAVRMAAGGRQRLASMASAVDFAFVAALAGAEAAPLRAAMGAPAPSYVAGPSPELARSADAGLVPASGAPGVEPTAFAPGGPTAVSTFADWPMPSAARAGQLPRGVFLWPEAAASAMDLADGEGEAHPLARAALDILAASEVVHAGVLAGASATDGTPALGGAAELVGATDVARASLPAGVPVPPTFEAIFVALSASPEGRTLPPTVRAARALAMAVNRAGGTAAPSSARERAAAAWAVMPTVIAGGVVEGPAPSAGGADAEPFVASRSRAGESLRSLVAPAAPGFDSQQSAHAYAAAPGVHPGASIQRELVQTAPLAAPAQERLDAQARAMASQARARGELQDLPPWLEEAARSMLEAGGEGEGLTFAEMTLVTSAPSRQVAASAHTADSAPSRARPADGHDAATEGKHDEPDVGKLAQKVYEELERLLAIARERSGDPWRV